MPNPQVSDVAPSQNGGRDPTFFTGRKVRQREQMREPGSCWRVEMGFSTLKPKVGWTDLNHQLLALPYLIFFSVPIVMFKFESCFKIGCWWSQSLSFPLSISLTSKVGLPWLHCQCGAAIAHPSKRGLVLWLLQKWLGTGPGGGEQYCNFWSVVMLQKW